MIEKTVGELNTRDIGRLVCIKVTNGPDAAWTDTVRIDELHGYSGGLVVLGVNSENAPENQEPMEWEARVDDKVRVKGGTQKQ